MLVKKSYRIKIICTNTVTKIILIVFKITTVNKVFNLRVIFIWECFLTTMDQQLFTFPTDLKWECCHARNKFCQRQVHFYILVTIETNLLVQSIESKHTVLFSVGFVMTLLLWRRVCYVYARIWVTDTNLWWPKFRNPASKAGGGLIELCLLPLRKRSMS